MCLIEWDNTLFCRIAASHWYFEVEVDGAFFLIFYHHLGVCFQCPYRVFHDRLIFAATAESWCEIENLLQFKYCQIYIIMMYCFYDLFLLRLMLRIRIMLIFFIGLCDKVVYFLVNEIFLPVWDCCLFSKRDN